MEVLVPFISLLSLLIAALVAYLTASVENRLTKKFDDRYVLNKEMIVLLSDREHWREDINRRMADLSSSQKDIVAEIRINRQETSEQIRQLREEIRTSKQS